jgi:ESCRT-II complex subunit VPS22
MRRRGFGAAAHMQNKQQQEKAVEVGKQMESEHLADMKGQLEIFKKNLEEFAMTHKKEISGNPVFRNQFLKMCKEIGVDPLSSNKGFWADVLGSGDFYYELAVSVS